MLTNIFTETFLNHIVKQQIYYRVSLTGNNKSFMFNIRVTMKMSKLFYYLIFLSDFNLFTVTRAGNNLNHFFQNTMSVPLEQENDSIEIVRAFSITSLCESIRP